MRPDAPAKSPTPSRETSTPPSPAPVSAVATRPKLNLQKRTVSEADPGLSPAASTSDSKASPFGAARPVDTLARDQEIEEKRQLALRQRREAEEKLKAEKAEDKRLAKDAKEGKDKVTTEQEIKETGASETQENGSETPQPGKNFEILRRTSEPANDMVALEDAEDEEGAGEGAIAEDKAVKPKEIIRDMPKAQANGAWRGKDTKKEPKKEPNSEPKSEPNTAGNLEEDGWSTVSKNTKQRNNRRGNQATRAIAS
jgi:translation initiation factor 4B